MREASGVDEAAAAGELESLLDHAVRLQLVADVPVGALLSGGIDSSLVVALMRRHTSRVRTFTIGFEEPRLDEAGYARAVAQHLGTDHTELRVTAQEAMAVIPKLPRLYAEPFADASQIPTFLVSELARRHVTVALSGRWRRRAVRRLLPLPLGKVRVENSAHRSAWYPAKHRAGARCRSSEHDRLRRRGAWKQGPNDVSRS